MSLIRKNADKCYETWQLFAPPCSTCIETETEHVVANTWSFQRQNWYSAKNCRVCLKRSVLDRSRAYARRHTTRAPVININNSTDTVLPRIQSTWRSTWDAVKLQLLLSPPHLGPPLKPSVACQSFKDHAHPVTRSIGFFVCCVTAVHSHHQRRQHHHHY